MSVILSEGDLGRLLRRIVVALARGKLPLRVGGLGLPVGLSPLSSKTGRKGSRMQWTLPRRASVY